MQSVAASGDGMILAGDRLFDPSSALAVRVEVVEHDPDLRDAFAHAGRLFGSRDLDAIAAHRHVVYLAGEGGSVEAGREMMAFADALIHAGGLAVKVETSGVAHRADDWLHQSARRDTHAGALFIAYVALVAGRESVYSCGMHNLGLPDAVLSAGLPTQQAGQLLKDFLMYLLHEQPALADHHTFSVTGDAARFALAHEPCRTFAPDDLYYNPFGMWRLTPLAESSLAS